MSLFVNCVLTLNGQILILADESLEDSVVHSDSRSLATLLLIRDIQVTSSIQSTHSNIVSVDKWRLISLNMMFFS